jgi:pimeloyl-ACP methyl ester carboxylesterase
MNLLSLGTADRSVFAIHEPAAKDAGRPRAAVICNPWGEEYLYAHRSLRQLALRLARIGFQTVRFDYFGTGDSGGDESQTDLAGMESDVRSAIEAARDIAGAAKVVLVGLRVGANIAARVASEQPADVESIVLWDPILSGEEYVRSILVPAGRAPTREIAVVRELRAIDPPTVPPELRERSLLIMTASEDSPADSPGIDADPRLHAWPTRASISAPLCWTESAVTTGALPIATLRRIEEWLQ